MVHIRPVECTGRVGKISISKKLKSLKRSKKMSSVILIVSLVVLSKFWIRLICSNFFFTNFFLATCLVRVFFFSRDALWIMKFWVRVMTKRIFIWAPPPYIFFRGKWPLPTHSKNYFRSIRFRDFDSLFVQINDHMLNKEMNCRSWYIYPCWDLQHATYVRW